MLGRNSERAAIEAELAAARDGASRTLVLVGEPGIGKSSLMEHAAEAAAGMQIARAAGIEAELHLDFAGLHRMLLPFLEFRDRLPGPQRDALGAAFGLAAHGPPDRFLVGLATLTLLADVSSRSPLVCLVDDAQWLDQESIEVLAFTSRRLHAERIAVIFAMRPSPNRPNPLEGFPQLPVAGLDDTSSAELLARSGLAALSADVVRQVLTETGGNPLALSELARSISDEQARGASPLPIPLPVGERLEASFLQQVRTLPEDAQGLLLLAAADASGDPTTIQAAARSLGLTLDASDPAVRAGLIAVRPRVEFRHPLVRSAVYTGATSLERRNVHLALAGATDVERDPDRRALHLAAASLGPDEDVAASLASAASRARGRGGYAAECSLLARAAELSPAGSTRAGRYLEAAQAAWSGGHPRRARSLLREATTDLDSPLLKATAKRLDGLLKAPFAKSALGPAILADAAADLVSLDREMARATYLDALDTFLIAYSFTEGTTGPEVARAALDFLSADEPSTAPEHLLLEAVARLVGSGFASAVVALRRVAEGLRTAEISDEVLMRWPTIAPLFANELLDDEGYRIMSTRLEQAARSKGALVALQHALLNSAAVDLRAGRFSQARERYAEVVEVTGAIGQWVDFYALLDVELLAWRGDPRTLVKARELEDQGRAAGSHATMYQAWVVLAVYRLGTGEYREAFDAANRIVLDDANGIVARVLPNAIEAAVRCGEQDAAREALALLELRAVPGAPPAALGVTLRSRALLATDDEAEALYLGAIESLSSTQLATELARSHLLFGEWLRRSNRRLEGREHLRTAFEMFSTMGADLFAERARVELAATGEHARKRTVETRTDLTPQEAQIARMAAARATSREIGAQLFISSKTVEYHLGKVFRKLGISSRRELPTVLARAGVEAS